MKMRRAIPHDAAMIGDVLASSYNIKDAAEGSDIFRDETERKFNYVVAEEGERVIGIASWVMHGLPKHGLCEMDRLAVLPEYRGMGIATQLFGFLARDADRFYKESGSSLRKLYLLTHATNKTAHSLYEKLGFKHEATLTKHYYPDKDEYIFSMFFDLNGTIP